MKGKQLFHGVEVKEWALICFAPPRKCNEDHMRNFTQKLVRSGNESGMPIAYQPCFMQYARHEKDVSFTFDFFHTLRNTFRVSLHVLTAVV